MSSIRCCPVLLSTSIKEFHESFSCSKMAYFEPRPAIRGLILELEPQITSWSVCKDFIPDQAICIPKWHSSAYSSVKFLGQEARFHFRLSSSVIPICHSGLRFECPEDSVEIHSTLPNWKNHSCAHFLPVAWRVVRDSILDLNGAFPRITEPSLKQRHPKFGSFFKPAMKILEA